MMHTAIIVAFAVIGFVGLAIICLAYASYLKWKKAIQPRNAKGQFVRRES